MFLLPKHKHYFSGTIRIDQAELYEDYDNISFDMFASHGRWNGPLLKSLIPDAFAVTILRRPNETFESLFSYTRLANKLHMNINQFAEALVNDKMAMIKAVEDQGGHSINDQLFDLGLEKDMMEDEDVMMQWIKKIDQEFDQVLLLEYFEEGLVLMAESLCWPLEHVTFAELNKRNKKFVVQMTETTQNTLDNAMKGDNMLYQYFLNIHRKKVKEYGHERMKREVENLKRKNTEIIEKCVTESKQKKSFIENNPLVKGREWCQPFFEKELPFLEKIKRMNMDKLKASINRNDE